jgi:nucleotide-binding universal stress UspA family protein
MTWCDIQIPNGIYTDSSSEHDLGVEPMVRRILCPIDFSDRASRVVDWAIHLAGEHDSEVVLLHAYHLPVELQQIEGAFIPDPFWTEVREEAERGLRPFAERVRGAGLCAREVAREGPPARVIEDEAERLRADMIVIGAAGRHALRDLLHGRITEHVVAHAPCPVLTVGREPGG